jgi:hypothetical protein
VALAVLGLFAVLGQPLQAQKLPSADKVVEKYWKAIGGKKRVSQVRDAAFEYTIYLNDEEMGIAKAQTSTPASSRSEMTFGNGQIIAAANASSAWVKGLDGELRTLTGAEGGSAKLQALLEAGHFIDYKKSNVAARVVPFADASSQQVFAVEFSTRGGARLVYYFSRSSGLITKISDNARKTTTHFSDYRPVEGLLQPHKLDLELDGTGRLTLMLQKVAYNTGVAASLFYAPNAVEVVNVVELLRQVGRNQDELEQRFSEYSFLQKETDREINSKGEIKKETVKVSEVFPIANREPVVKLISENGVPLSPERAAKEEKRVLEEFEKAERDRDKDAQRQQRIRAERAKKRAKSGSQDDSDVEISQFLRVCEFVSPRRERFRDREAVVFDFRPKPGFKPSNREEDLISKLVGVVWIDPVDKQVMRLEARLAEGFKIAGGLAFSLRPGASVVMEQTRMNEGIWLPRLAQVNLSMKILLFGGGDLNKTFEWSDYKHFSGDVRDYKLDAPKTTNTGSAKPQ